LCVCWSLLSVHRSLFILVENEIGFWQNLVSMRPRFSFECILVSFACVDLSFACVSVSFECIQVSFDSSQRATEVLFYICYTSLFRVRHVSFTYDTRLFYIWCRSEKYFSCTSDVRLFYIWYTSLLNMIHVSFSRDKSLFYIWCRSQI